VKKTKTYRDAKFSPKVIKDALHALDSCRDAAEAAHFATPYLVTRSGNETWNFDSLSEFFAGYDDCDWGWLEYRWKCLANDSHAGGLELTYSPNETSGSTVSVTLLTKEDIERVFRVFEDNLSDSMPRPQPEPIRIFIGHGRDPQWRDLRDHLQDSHGYEIVAYEIGERAGQSVKEVLQDMLEQASFALLVFTAEDAHVDGEQHARENVIHEIGLFQGALGFERAIVLLEKGCKEFSNILGINQVRFREGGIRETFGDVLATIRREFGDTIR